MWLSLKIQDNKFNKDTEEFTIAAFSTLLNNKFERELHKRFNLLSREINHTLPNPVSTYHIECVVGAMKHSFSGIGKLSNVTAELKHYAIIGSQEYLDRKQLFDELLVVVDKVCSKVEQQAANAVRFVADKINILSCQLSNQTRFELDARVVNENTIIDIRVFSPNTNYVASITLVLGVV